MVIDAHQFANHDRFVAGLDERLPRVAKV